MNNNSQAVGGPVRATGGEPANNSLIAESAFAIVASGSARDVATSNESVDTIRGHLAKYGMNPPRDSVLDSDELREIDALVGSMRGMFARLGPVEYWPTVPGCGVVDSAHADVLAVDTLYEVKTVTRAFRGSDVRQLLTYCAMFEASGKVLNSIGLLNPRRGVVAAASLDFVCQGASGLSRPELMREIVRRMAEMQVSG